MKTMIPVTKSQKFSSVIVLFSSKILLGWGCTLGNGSTYISFYWFKIETNFLMILVDISVCLLNNLFCQKHFRQLSSDYQERSYDPLLSVTFSSLK